MSQTQKLSDLLDDGEKHRTDEILLHCYGSEHLGLARISARVYDLKKQGHTIISWPDSQKPSLTYYQEIKYNLNGEPLRKETSSTN